MLTPYLPWPLNSGGQIRTYNLLKNLAHKHEISLFSFIRDDDEKKYVGKLKPYCRKIMLFKRTQSPWAIRNILLAGLTPYPFLVCIYLSKAAKDALTQELNQEKYDIIHAETFYVMPNIPATEIPTLLVEQTIEYLGYQTYTAQTAMPFLRPMLYIDVIKLKFWEKHYWRKADRVFAVSSEDKKVMQELIPGLEVGVIPNGVDADYYAEKKLPRKSPPCVMYGVTNFEWLQNVEAVRELVTKVWPGIIAKVPGVRLWIVGRMIPSWIKEMSEKRSDIFSSPESIEKNWQNILSKVEAGDESNWKIAVIEADKMLDDVLKRIGYTGADMGERLKQIKSDELSNIDNIWQAHKVRNRIAHEPEFRLTQSQAKQAVEIFQRALEDLQAI